MFVESPPLNHNGDVITKNPGYRVYADGYLTLEAARDNEALRSYVQGGYDGYTYRDGMRSGIVDGRKTVTDYYSLRVRNEYGKPYKQVIQYTEGGTKKYGVLEVDARFGYINGFETGLGDPIHQFLLISGRGWEGVANRAISDNAYNRAKVEVLSKARQQKLDLSESFVDLDKSVMMVAQRASQVLKALLAARRGNWPEVWHVLGLKDYNPKKRRNVAGITDFLSKGWLEVTYGWLPLLYDIQAGVDFVNNGLKAGPSGLFHATRKVTTSLPFCSFFESTGANLWDDISVVSNVTHDVKVRYDMRVNNSTLAYLSGIGLDNPAYLAWVGTPFSFVVDWLMPVSPWLQSLTTPLGLTLIDGSISRRTSGTIDGELKRYYGSTSSRPIVYESPPQKVRCSFVELKREKVTSFPLTTPYFRLPFSNPQRVVSTLALFNQLKLGR